MRYLENAPNNIAEETEPSSSPNLLVEVRKNLAELIFEGTENAKDKVTEKEPSLKGTPGKEPGGAVVPRPKSEQSRLILIEQLESYQFRFRCQTIFIPKLDTVSGSSRTSPLGREEGGVIKTDEARGALSTKEPEQQRESSQDTDGITRISYVHTYSKLVTYVRMYTYITPCTYVRTSDFDNNKGNIATNGHVCDLSAYVQAQRPPLSAVPSRTRSSNECQEQDILHHRQL